MIVKNRVLAAALFASCAWHLIWISAIRVVIVPEAHAVKFSKVSFLGPVIGGKTLEVRMESRPRSFLEKRFSLYADRVAPKFPPRQGDDFVKDFTMVKESDFATLVSATVSGTKSVPLPSSE
jgi:hypothetical protein